MSELAADDAAALADGETGWQRLHPGTLVLALFRLGPRAVNFVPAAAALGITGNWTYIIPMLGLFLLFSLVFAALNWWRFRYRMAGDAFVIESGLFSRRHSTLPFDRIQDVGIEQGVIARLFGLAKVSFDTGAATEAKGDKGNMLDAIALADAAALRDAIRARRVGAFPAPLAATVPATDTQKESADELPLFAMSVRRVLTAGMFNFSLAALAVFGGFAQQFDDVLPIDIYNVDGWIALAAGLGLDQWVMAHQWLAAAGAGFVLLAVGFGTGVVRSLLADWDFRLMRTPAGFRRTRGLLTRTDVVIPHRRVAAAITSTGWLRRRFGWHDLRLQSLANDGDKERDHVVVPFGRASEVDDVLGALGYARPGPEARWSHAHWSVATGELLFALVPLGAALGLITYGIMWGALAAFATPVLAASALFSASRHRWAVEGDMLYIERGFRTPRLILLPRASIQTADVGIGPVARRFGVAKISFGVPGGSSFSAHEIEGIDAEAAFALRNALIPVRAATAGG
jgi:putative membrane protein